jgi:hypothetical protein
MPRRAHSPSTALNSVLLDVLCGQARTLGKFKVLELVAGVPYLSWEGSPTSLSPIFTGGRVCPAHPGPDR